MLSEDVSRLWDAMKIGPQWLLRTTEAVDRQAESASHESAAAAAPRTAAAKAAAPAEVPRPHEPVPAAQYTAPAAADLKPVKPVSRITPIAPEVLEKIASAGWETLAAIAAECRACEMGSTRQQVVLADGTAPCGFVVVGEAPGREEDIQGLPFVGKSGQLLTAMLNAIGIARPEGVTIVNVVKCRPPENRDPAPEELDLCAAYLRRQLELLKPRVVLLTGRFAMMELLGLTPETSISSQRGRVHEVNWQGLTFKAVVTYHPSYLLRRPQEKAKAWDDLLLLKGALRAEGLLKD